MPDLRQGNGAVLSCTSAVDHGMTSFFLRYEEWDCAAAAAASAAARLGRQLDAYCDGTGPAPAAEEIAEFRRLHREANRRLAALRALLQEQRAQVALI
jgi:hypothetical protein